MLPPLYTVPGKGFCGVEGVDEPLDAEVLTVPVEELDEVLAPDEVEFLFGSIPPDIFVQLTFSVSSVDAQFLLIPVLKSSQECLCE